MRGRLTTGESALPRPGARALAWLLLSLALALIITLLPAPAVRADERAIDQAEERVAALQAEAEAATEAHHEARLRLRAIERDIATLETRLERTRSQLAGVSRTLNAVAATTWVNGGVDPSLQLLLAPDAEVFLSTASALDQVARTQNAALRRTTALRLQLQQDQVQLASRRAEAAVVVREMAALKESAQSKLRAAERVLAGLKADQRRAYLARQKAKREAAKAAAARERAAAGAATVAAPARVQKVLTYALAQVGDRYVLAADGDDSFDCSGLVVAAFKRAGIALPHSSRAQFAATKRIGRNQLRPGDLVFYFRRGAAHVGIYIGNNRMVHASNPREDVIITRLDDPWYVARYSGAGRVVG